MSWEWHPTSKVHPFLKFNHQTLLCYKTYRMFLSLFYFFLEMLLPVGDRSIWIALFLYAFLQCAKVYKLHWDFSAPIIQGGLYLLWNRGLEWEKPCLLLRIVKVVPVAWWLAIDRGWMCGWVWKFSQTSFNVLSWDREFPRGLISDNRLIYICNCKGKKEGKR